MTFSTQFDVFFFLFNFFFRLVFDSICRDKCSSFLRWSSLLKMRKLRNKKFRRYKQIERVCDVCARKYKMPQRFSVFGLLLNDAMSMVWFRTVRLTSMRVSFIPQDRERERETYQMLLYLLRSNSDTINYAAIRIFYFTRSGWIIGKIKNACDRIVFFYSHFISVRNSFSLDSEIVRFWWAWFHLNILTNFRWCVMKIDGNIDQKF